jgi:hypothetical protein
LSLRGRPAFCRAARQRETADQATVEYQPATDVPGHFLLVHLYLLAEMGSPMMEIAYLEELARDPVYEFASRRCVCVARPAKPLRG